jgi:hypothetical protein
MIDWPNDFARQRDEQLLEHLHAQRADTLEPQSFEQRLRPVVFDTRGRVVRVDNDVRVAEFSAHGAIRVPTSAFRVCQVRAPDGLETV